MVIFRGEAEIAIVSVADWVRTGLLLSRTFTVKLDVPLVVGTPEMAPFDASVRPAGRVPAASDHV